MREQGRLTATEYEEQLMPRPEVPQPDRYTGLPPGVQVGPLTQRLVAYLVDHGVPALIALVTLGLPASGADRSPALTAVGLLLIGLWALVAWWLVATRAASLGMRLTKLQLVGFADGRPVGWGRALLRFLVLTALTVTGVGLVLMLVLMVRHPRHQGWHDRAVAAVVIKQRALAPRLTPTRTAAQSASSQALAAPVDAAPAEPARPAVTIGSSAAVNGTGSSTGHGAHAALVDVGGQAGFPTNPGTTIEGVVPGSTRSMPRWRVVLDDGRDIDVRGLVVVGRRPQRRPGEDEAELVSIPDDTRTMSKSHVSLNVDDRGLFVMDRGSTNGSTVTAPSGQPQRCVPWEAVYLSEGSVVSMGDHWLKVQAP